MKKTSSKCQISSTLNIKVYHQPQNKIYAKCKSLTDHKTEFTSLILFLFRFSFRFVRMFAVTFEHLLSLVHDNLCKKLHVIVPLLSVERLAVNGRHLATGDSQKFIVFLFKLGRLTVNGVIGEVYEELWPTLPDYVKVSDDWKKIASYLLWNMPHCISALDDKQILICKPTFSGSL